MTYKEQLLTENWRNLKNKVLKRDNNKCVRCRKKENLHIHHLSYIKTKKAWEYPLKNFKTLCNICHEEEHKNRHISTFFKKQKPKKNNLTKDQRKLKRMYESLSPKELELQLKRDSIIKNININ